MPENSNKLTKNMDLLRKHLKKRKKLKNIKKTGTLVATGTAIGIEMVDKISPKIGDQIHEKMDQIHNRLEITGEKLDPILNELQKQFDALIGDKIEEKLILLEDFVYEKGGDKFERLLIDNIDLVKKKVSKPLFSSLNKIIKKDRID